MSKNYFDLSGQVAIVTGCSTGLGVQMAKALANQGAKIVAIARRKEKIDAVAKEISDEYKKLSEEHNLNYLDLMLHVGEDFELVFTIPKDNLKNLDIDYKVIGEVTDTGKIEIVLENGAINRLDLLCVGKSEITVVDYKSGSPKEEHKEQ